MRGREVKSKAWALQEVRQEGEGEVQVAGRARQPPVAYTSHRLSEDQSLQQLFV